MQNHQRSQHTLGSNEYKSRREPVKMEVHADKFDRAMADFMTARI